MIEIVTDTNLCRGNQTIRAIDRFSLNQFGKIRLLMVGLGLDSSGCCYEPFTVAAHLEGLNIDYSMTLLDIDQEILDNVASRNHIFIPGSCYNSRRLDADSYGDTWDKYLKDIKTNPKYHMGNFLSAAIPQSFKAKRQFGDIAFICQDITQASFSPKSFELVECLNVLYMLTYSNQEKAIENMAEALVPGGLLLINDVGANYGKAVMEKLGGWLGDVELENLNLSAVENPYPLSFTLRKSML